VACARIAVTLATAVAVLAGPDAASALRLSVPLDHTGSVPGTLTLRVDRDSKPRASEPVALVLPALAGTPAADPYEWEELMPRHQIVTFDPRGTGKGALRCRDLEAADPADAGAEAAACATLLGDRRGFFRASDTVEDIEALRQWIGVDQLTIVGPGYGSYVAQRYALRYPEHVSRLILTSVIDAAGADPLSRDAPVADSSHIDTPVEVGMRTAARFPRGQFLVTSLSPLDTCTELAVFRFMRGRQVQDRCPRTGAPIPPAAPAPASVRELAPVRGVPGRRGRLLKAFALTFGDLVDDLYAEIFSNPSSFGSALRFRGGGLRGGSVIAGEEILRLDRYEFVPGVRLSGRWNVEKESILLRIDGPGRLDGRIWISEPDGDDLVFRVRGRIAGRRIRTRVVIRSRLIDAIEQSIDGSPAAAALPLLP
jgi:pimeloyl-ACP methyl ester carboxylesterase